VPSGGRLLEAAQQGDRAAIEQLLRSNERLVWRALWSLPAGERRARKSRAGGEDRIGHAMGAFDPDQDRPALAVSCC
jgi:hypothetical protein